jgi:hypothetical protein
MSFIEKFQTLNKEDAQAELFAMLNDKAMDVLSTMEKNSLAVSEGYGGGRMREDDEGYSRTSKADAAYNATLAKTKSVDNLAKMQKSKKLPAQDAVKVDSYSTDMKAK